MLRLSVISGQVRFGDETNLIQAPESISEQLSFQTKMKKSVEALKTEKRDKPDERQSEGKKIGFQLYKPKE